MARLWITRTRPAANESAQRLSAMGYDVIAAPVLEVEYNPAVLLPPEGSHLIFTSRNGVGAFAAATSLRDWPCICVGDASADTARKAGFENVTSAQGNANDLTAWVIAHLDKTVPLYHAAGQNPRGEIIERLRASGFSSAVRETFYGAHPVRHDPRRLTKHDDIVLLYSPMAAQALIGFDLDMTDMTVIALSRAVDAALGDKTCKARYIAEYPREDSLFAHIP